MNAYGEAPRSLGRVDCDSWTEFMHYLYLPVRLPADDGGVNVALDVEDDAVLPPRLEFLRTPVYTALNDAITTASHLRDPYVYITARRGFASPGNPLNRPGWHCDDFGGRDLNYIWSDRFPTRLLLAPGGLTIPEDDQASMKIMEQLAWAAQETYAPSMSVEECPVGELVRLTPHVIHDTPVIPEPGGMRSFFKISISTERYDLVGNSHNYDLHYDWRMVDRSALRNQPVGGDRDYSRVARDAMMDRVYQPTNEISDRWTPR